MTYLWQCCCLKQCFCQHFQCCRVNKSFYHLSVKLYTVWPLQPLLLLNFCQNLNSLANEATVYPKDLSTHWPVTTKNLSTHWTVFTNDLWKNWTVSAYKLSKHWAEKTEYQRQRAVWLPHYAVSPLYSHQMLSIRRYLMEREVRLNRE